MEFRDWLMDKFVAWEREQPRRQSYSAFARYLGIKVPLLTQWRLGNNLPSIESARILADKLGNEVYGVLGYASPDGDNLDTFPPRLREALLAARGTIISRGLAGDSPEAAQVVIDAMSAAGYKLILTNDDESPKSNK